MLKIAVGATGGDRYIAKTFKLIKVLTVRSIRKQSGTAVNHRPCFLGAVLFFARKPIYFKAIK